MIYIIGDTETAGLGVEKIPVEIALRQIDEQLNTVKEWASLVDPQIPINPMAMAVHGITDEMVKLAPTVDEFIGHVLGQKFKEDICLIGHKVAFDQPLLEFLGNITNSICTLELSRTYIPAAARYGKVVIQPPNGPYDHKLQTLRKWLGFPEGEAHRAMSDVNDTHLLLKEVVRLSGSSLPNFVKTKSRVIHIMPFGKYIGRSLFELPLDYINVILGYDDIDVNLRTSLTNAKLLKEKK